MWSQPGAPDFKIDRPSQPRSARQARAFFFVLTRRRRCYTLLYMKVYLASDHAGFALKNALTEFLLAAGHEAVDLGPHDLDPKDDYPDFIGPLALRVSQEIGSFGIAIGSSGQGEAMAANRTPGARAMEFYGGDMEIIRAAREHNNANILSLGARFVSEELAKEAVTLFLGTPFSGEERHARRIEKLDHPDS